MDPDSAWRDLLDALHRQDYDEAVEIATDLYEWLSCGGFPPCVVPQLRQAVHIAGFST